MKSCLSLLYWELIIIVFQWWLDYDNLAKDIIHSTIHWSPSKALSPLVSIPHLFSHISSSILSMCPNHLRTRKLSLEQLARHARPDTHTLIYDHIPSRYRYTKE